MITTKPLKATCVDGDRHRRHGDACLARDRRGRALCVCKVAGVGDVARQAVRALDAGAAAPAPRPRLEDWRRFGPALLPPRVGPWVGGVEVDVRAAEVAVRAVAAAA